MYDEGKLVLQNLLKALQTVLSQLRKQLQIHRLQNLSQAKLQVEASTDDALSMYRLFLVLFERVTNLSSEVHNTLRSKNVKYVAESAEVILRVMDDVLFMPSPTICIDTNPDSTKTDVSNRLALTPIEGENKSERRESVWYRIIDLFVSQELTRRYLLVTNARRKQRLSLQS